MSLDETAISRSIIEGYLAKLRQALEVEVALAGAGPSNLWCGALLGEAGVRAAVFEAGLAPGGGMWGGGMGFNEIVVQERAMGILDRLRVRTRPAGEGLFAADSVETTASLVARCVQAGTPVFNLVQAEDVLFQEEEGRPRVSGLVLQWSPVRRLGLHVDPLAIRARFVVDGTGHPAEIATLVARKVGAVLDTPTGGVVGEKAMWAEQGELFTVEKAGQVFPGLFVTGMAANATVGGPRMGPIFGGMLLAGEKVARELVSRLRGAS